MKYFDNTASHPGGCEIGPRPIDLHLKALKLMGADIHEARGLLYCKASSLKACDIQLDYPSVGATENIMLAAVFTKGETIIRNAAKEPEIVDLQKYLIAMGVDISGAGTEIITVRGSEGRLLDVVEHTVIPDRIVAGTYMIASAITGGDVTLKNCSPTHLGSLISNLKEAGCTITSSNNSTLNIKGPVRTEAIDIIRSLPYPGFPTDMQAQMVAMLSLSKGTSIMVETVFENRFRYVEELARMGANITVEGRIAVIKGVKRLTGAHVNAKDLRGGAALVLAGLASCGETLVEGDYFINRGYENFTENFEKLGAIIKKED